MAGHRRNDDTRNIYGHVGYTDTLYRRYDDRSMDPLRNYTYDDLLRT